MIDTTDLENLGTELLGTTLTIAEALEANPVPSCLPLSEDWIEDWLLTEGIEQCMNCDHWRLSVDMIDDPDFSYCIVCQ